MAAGRTSSVSVFHSPQPGHCPSQRGASAPQEEQTKTVEERAMDPTTVGPAPDNSPPGMGQILHSIIRFTVWWTCKV